MYLYQKTSFGSVARIENSMSVKFHDNWTFSHGALPIFLFHTKPFNFQCLHFCYWFLLNILHPCCPWVNFSSRSLKKKLETNIINGFLLLSVMRLGGKWDFLLKKITSGFYANLCKKLKTQKPRGWSDIKKRPIVVLPLSRTAHLQRFMVIGRIPTELYQYFSSIQNLVILDPSTFFSWFLFNNFDHCRSWGHFSSRPLRKN